MSAPESPQPDQFEREAGYLPADPDPEVHTMSGPDDQAHADAAEEAALAADPDAVAEEGTGAAGPIEEDLSPAPLNPEPLPGFVRMSHPDLDATADVPEVAVNVHKARGWALVTDEPEPEPNPNPEASASVPEED